MDKEMENFVEDAKHFCSLAEELVISMDRLKELMLSVLQLYEKALHLPNTEPSEADYSQSTISALPLKMEIRDYYWSVFDPFDDSDEDKVVCMMISDDINDIYRDLKEGLRAYESGDFDTAIWIWKFGVDNHWGVHAVNLIKALHWIRTDRISK